MLQTVALSILIACIITASFLVFYLVVILVYRTLQRIFVGRRFPAECTKEAIEESQELVRAGADKAQEIISGAQLFNKELRRDFEASLNQIMKKQLGSFEQMSRQVLDTYKKSIDDEKRLNQEALLSGTNEIKEEIMSEIKTFEENLHKETLGSQEMVEQKIKQEYEKLEQELKDYKEQQMRKIDNNLYKVLANATEKIIEEAVDLRDKENIVMNCLEEAKREGMFNS